jgi:hypothetical protein
MNEIYISSVVSIIRHHDKNDVQYLHVEADASTYSQWTLYHSHQQDSWTYHKRFELLTVAAKAMLKPW